MKLISFAVPCYNSEAYMAHCVDTLLHGGEDVEIILVNDGSKDGTLRIAREYEAKYPQIVRVVDKENGGHGSGVNAGLAVATGIYYKVVDSDDWVDEQALDALLCKIREFTEKDECPDCIYCNYVYEHTATGEQIPVRYKGVFPKGRIFTWDEVGRFGVSQYIMMHTVIQRRQMLLDCGLRLPEHTFYVDVLLVYHAMPYIRTMYYLDVDLYRYFIGRVDQSVNEAVLLKRKDQQVRVAKCMIADYPLEKVTCKPLRRAMAHQMSILLASTTSILFVDGSKESLATNREVWDMLRTTDPCMYRALRGTLGRMCNRRTALGRKLSVFCYHMSKKIYKFA